jgi:hypothetical protein
VLVAEIVGGGEVHDALRGLPVQPLADSHLVTLSNGSVRERGACRLC